MAKRHEPAVIKGMRSWLAAPSRSKSYQVNDDMVRTLLELYDSQVGALVAAEQREKDLRTVLAAARRGELAAVQEAKNQKEKQVHLQRELDELFQVLITNYLSSMLKGFKFDGKFQAGGVVTGPCKSGRLDAAKPNESQAPSRGYFMTDAERKEVAEGTVPDAVVQAMRTIDKFACDKIEQMTGKRPPPMDVEEVVVPLPRKLPPRPGHHVNARNVCLHRIEKQTAEEAGYASHGHPLYGDKMPRFSAAQVHERLAAGDGLWHGNTKEQWEHFQRNFPASKFTHTPTPAEEPKESQASFLERMQAAALSLGKGLAASAVQFAGNDDTWMAFVSAAEKSTGMLQQDYNTPPRPSTIYGIPFVVDKTLRNGCLRVRYGDGRTEDFYLTSVFDTATHEAKKHKLTPTLRPVEAGQVWVSVKGMRFKALKVLSVSPCGCFVKARDLHEFGSVGDLFNLAWPDVRLERHQWDDFQRLAVLWTGEGLGQ